MMPNHYIIHPIPLVIAELPKPLMTYLFNHGQTVRVGQFVWYLEGPKENILVDAGCTTERITARGMKAETVQTLDDGLNKLGLGLSDIDTIIVTHMDHDHIALLRNFPKARFIVQRAELEFARNPHPIFKAWRPGDYMALIDGLDFEVVEGDVEIDKGIDILFSPGHTPGGQSVAVKTAEGTAVITGWCGIQENIDPPPEIREKGLSFIAPGIHSDLMEAFKSITRVKNMADIIIPLHAVELVNKPTIP